MWEGLGHEPKASGGAWVVRRVRRALHCIEDTSSTHFCYDELQAQLGPYGRVGASCGACGISVLYLRLHLLLKLWYWLFEKAGAMVIG